MVHIMFAGHNNKVNFLTNINKRLPKVYPLGPGMGCVLRIQHLVNILLQFLQLLMQYLTVLDRVLTALDCIPPDNHQHTTYSTVPL